MQRGAVLLGEEPAGVDPLRSPGQPLGGLVGLPAAQPGDCVGVEGNGAGAAVGLRLAGLGLPAELHDLFGYGHRGVVEVDLVAGQADGLTAAESAVRDEQEQRPRSVRTGPRTR